MSAQRTELQLRHIYVIYVRLYLNEARIMSDYANYISAKHKTDSAISYSRYTRFYALISRVCTPAKTRGFSSSKRNKEALRKGGNSQVPHPSPKWREVSRQSRETATGTRIPISHDLRPRRPQGRKRRESGGGTGFLSGTFRTDIFCIEDVDDAPVYH